MGTAAEMLLRQQEFTRRMAPHWKRLNDMLVAPLIEKIAARFWWETSLQEAMRSTAFQLTYNPKD